MNHLKIKKINLIIADDHEIFRIGLEKTIKSIECIKNIHHAANGIEVLEIIKKNKNTKRDCIQVVLMDYSMPEMNGAETTIKIRELYKEIQVIGISCNTEDVVIEKFYDSGISGFLFKSTSNIEIEKALHALCVGKKYYTPEIAELILNKFIVSPSDKGKVNKIKLTETEEKIIKLSRKGLSSKLIADELNLSVRTIENHKYIMMRKTNTVNICELCAWGNCNGYPGKAD
jgi:DNA-binding NarL/FixJ family response regulator